MKEIKDTNFSKYVRSLLLLNEKTQVWLAEQFGMSNNSIQNKLKNDSFSIAEQHFVRSILTDPSRLKPLTLSKAEFACLADVADVDRFIVEHDVCLTREGRVLVSLSREARRVLGEIHVGDTYRGVRVISVTLSYSNVNCFFSVLVKGVKDGKVTYWHD